MIENIIISTRSLNEIKMGFGYPVIDGESSYLISDTNLKDYIIAPALEEYFTFFPIAEVEAVTLAGGSTSTLEYPEQFMGVLDYKFVPKSKGVSSNVLGPSGNPFYTQSLITSRGGMNGGGKFGTPFNYGFNSNYSLTKTFSDALENSNKVWYAEPDHNNQLINLYASIDGDIVVTWGLYSEDFDNATPLRKRQELISFCKAKYKRQLGEILGLQQSGLPEQIDFERLMEEADEEIERLRIKWADEGRRTVMR